LNPVCRGRERLHYNECISEKKKKIKKQKRIKMPRAPTNSKTYIEHIIHEYMHIKQEGKNVMEITFFQSRSNNTNNN
jgi:hypothetical protein